MYMHLEMMKCCIPSLGHCDLDLVSGIGIESGVSPIFFEHRCKYLFDPNIPCGSIAMSIFTH